MKKLFLYAIMMAAITVSCNEMGLDPIQGGEELQPVPGVKMITETLTGGRDVETKVTINNTSGAFAWTKYDNLAVHVSKGDSHKYVFTKGDGGASIAAAMAAFTVSYEEGYARDAFAVFPSTIVAENASNYGQSSTALDVTLPASYTLAQLTGETTPCPMIATNDPASSSWNFMQLCGLLRLTVNSIPPSTKRLEIDFDGKKVCGSFSIASPVTPGTSVIATTADDSHDIITITKDGTDVTLNGSAWLDGLVLNIPLPTGDYTNITVTAYDALTGGNAVITKSSAFAFTSNRQNATKRTASFPIFSVSSTKRVIFAPGNLQATTTNGGTSWTWKFAENQYDRIGAAAANNQVNGNGTISATSGTVDLFGRSTSSTYYGISNSTSADDYNGVFVDWGNMDIDGKGTNYWFTLAEKEWQYLLGEGIDAQSNYRHNGGTVSGVGNALCTKAKVNGMRGFIIFPDKYAGGTPNGVTWDVECISPGDMAKSGTDGWGATITLEGWSTLAKEGCVFLPAGGRRSGNSVFSCSNSDSDYALYLSSDSGKILRVENDGFDPNQSFSSYYGFSVRLAHVIN